MPRALIEGPGLDSPIVTTATKRRLFFGLGTARAKVFVAKREIVFESTGTGGLIQAFGGGLSVCLALRSVVERVGFELPARRFRQAEAGAREAKSVTV